VVDDEAEAERVHEVSGPDSDRQMRVVVRAGAGSDEGVDVVNRRLADRRAVGAGREGFACPVLHGERRNRVDDPLLKSSQIRDWLDDDPGQPEIPLHEGIEADRPGLPVHRLLCLQHAFHSIRDRVEVRCPHLRRPDGAAVAAELREADVVEDDEHDVGGSRCSLPSDTTETEVPP
jgi:hypothetical protein